MMKDMDAVYPQIVYWVWDINNNCWLKDHRGCNCVFSTKELALRELEEVQMFDTSSVYFYEIREIVSIIA